MGQAESSELLDNLPTAECYEASDAIMATVVDTRAEDAPHASERVLSVAWPNAMSIAADSSFSIAMGRTLPWNYFHQDSGSILEALFALRVSTDSCHPSLQDQVSDPLLKLTGTPLHTQYVDRELLGLVINDSWDSHPTNATPWDEQCLEDGDARIPHVELARCHAGERGLREDCDGTSAEGYDPKRYVPIVTKAGSRLWSLGFAAPDTQQVTEMRASYPGQLLVRIDKAGGNIIYDCFEFKPLYKDAFSTQMQLAREGAGEWPISADELKQAERIMANSPSLGMFHHMLPVLRSETGQLVHVHDIGPIDRDASISDRCKRLGTTRLHVLTNWIRFQKSRLMRVRFPMDAICGARLVTIDYDRPHQDIPPVVRRLSTSQLGEHGDSDDSNIAEPGTMEACNEDLEPLGVLVLEFSQAGANMSNNPNPFCSTVIWPKNWRDRKRRLVEADWTPDMAFSKSTRHYIVGDASEIVELANALMEVSPRLKAMLLPSSFVSGEKEAAAEGTDPAAKADSDSSSKHDDEGMLKVASAASAEGDRPPATETPSASAPKRSDTAEATPSSKKDGEESGKAASSKAARKRAASPVEGSVAGSEKKRSKGDTVDQKEAQGKASHDDEENQVQADPDALMEVLESFNSLSGDFGKLKPSLTEQVQSLTSQAAAKALHEVGIINDTPAACKGLPFQTTNDVHDFLRRCGVKHPERVNPCLKAGLLNGNVKVPEILVTAEDASPFLDTVLLECKCISCKCDTLVCTVRNAFVSNPSGLRMKMGVKARL